MSSIQKEFTFGTITIKGNLVIGVMKEGIHLDMEDNRKIMSYCYEHFQGRAYGYISYRCNPYSLDPTVYMDVSQQPGLRAIAVVTQQPLCASNVMLERQFYQFALESFRSLETACEWMKKELEISTIPQDQSQMCL